jgi:hypothetical protein
MSVVVHPHQPPAGVADEINPFILNNALPVA